jgi:hypothetical protein
LIWRGISDTDEFEVPAATCLYEIIGVTLATKVRYGGVLEAQPSWPVVYVGTPWGPALVVVHLEHGAPHDRDVRFEACR